MDDLIDELERIAALMATDPVGGPLLATAIASLRAGRSDDATAFELSLLAETETWAGRSTVAAVLQQASELLKPDPPAPGHARRPRGRLH